MENATMHMDNPGSADLNGLVIIYDLGSVEKTQFPVEKLEHLHNNIL